MMDPLAGERRQHRERNQQSDNRAGLVCADRKKQRSTDYRPDQRPHREDASYLGGKDGRGAANRENQNREFVETQNRNDRVQSMSQANCRRNKRGAQIGSERLEKRTGEKSGRQRKP